MENADGGLIGGLKAMASQRGMVRFNESDSAEVEKALADLRAKLADDHYCAAMLFLDRRVKLPKVARKRRDEELVADTMKRAHSIPMSSGDEHNALTRWRYVFN